MMAFSTNANPEDTLPMTAATVSSPWTQTAKIIPSESEPIHPSSANSPPATTTTTEKAAESFPAPTEEESVEENGNGGANAGKRPAWKKPSNGPEVGIGPVMGAHSWPALSDAARASSNKSPSADSLKGLAADSSSPVSGSQGIGSIPLSPQRQVSNTSNTTATQNHTIPSRQRSIKRNGNSSSSGGISHPPSQQGSAAEGTINNHSPKDHTQRSGYVSQFHGGGDHSAQRPHFRNRNSHNNNYGGRNFNGRDTHLQPQRGHPRFTRQQPPPPPSMSAPFIHSQVPQQVRPFNGFMGFNDFHAPMYYVPDPLRGVPFIAPMPMYFPAADPQLPFRIVNQIDYYFSNENLVKDVYLRQNMDDQGWVPIQLIAGFKKVSYLTDNIQLVLDSLRNSTVVEVQGDKVRSRHNWRTWIPRSPVQLPNVSVTQPHGNSVFDMLAAGVQNVSLDPNTSGWSQADGRAEAS